MRFVMDSMSCQSDTDTDTDSLNFFFFMEIVQVGAYVDSFFFLCTVYLKCLVDEIGVLFDHCPTFLNIYQHQHEKAKSIVQLSKKRIYGGFQEAHFREGLQEGSKWTMTSIRFGQVLGRFLYMLRNCLSASAHVCNVKPFYCRGARTCNAKFI